MVTLWKESNYVEQSTNFNLSSMVRASVTESSSSYITIRQRFPSKYSLQMGRRVLGVEERSSYEEQCVSFRWYAKGNS